MNNSSMKDNCLGLKLSTACAKLIIYNLLPKMQMSQDDMSNKYV